MATINYKWGIVCAGGEHLGLDVSFNGAAVQRITYSSSEIRQPITNFTREEREALLLMLLKLHFAGKTATQARTELQATAGVTITI